MNRFSDNFIVNIAYMRSIFLITATLLFVNAFAQTDSLTVKFPVDSAYLTSFDGTKIYYEVRGEGKPVLLVHGFIVNRNSWKNTALYKDLLQSGYKVIVLDMRGNGRSDKPQDSLAYDNDAEAKDIMLLMDKLNIKKYAVIGYSRGSIITARLLVLDKHVVAAGMGGMGTDFANPNWPRRIMFYHAMMGEDVPELKGAVEYVKSQGLNMRVLGYLQRSQPSTPKEVLQKVRKPVLVICGDKDADNGSAEDLAKLFPNATYVITTGDHNHAAATKEFSEAVRKFLEKNY